MCVKNRCCPAWVLALLALSVPWGAAAQSLGARAAGMGEAFVAVADDATAVYWNPAGMATGAYLSFVVDFGTGASDGESGGQRSATSSGTRFVGATMPALGLAYYRQARWVATSPAGMAASSREDGRQSVQGLATSTVGITLGQSLADYLVVAGTVKLVRGAVSSGDLEAREPEAALDRVGTLPVEGTTRVDADVGAMVTAGRWRVGLVARHLAAPRFSQPDAAVAPAVLDRELRVGAAWGSGWPGTSRVVVSADADVTHRTTAGGERRDVAAGVETWWLGQRLGLRGGLRGSTLGGSRPVVAGGLSAAVRTGVFVEAHVAGGERAERTWSVGARLSF